MTIRDRLFRAAIVAAVGAGAGFVLMLSIDTWQRASAEKSYLLEATLMGAAVGAVMGFLLADADWLHLLRRR